ncbi:MAG TPA: rRNA maturation RNase YbeY [Longimicrobiales bacterium]|nr:rRNA maturation RNase YbeY [Longimicrobiales bacterium]
MDAGGFEEAPVALLERAVRRTLAAEGLAEGDEDEGHEEMEISVALLDDVAIRELNRRWLGHDRPTDVLAFALGGPGGAVGDVYIGMEQARRQAAEAGVPLAEELARLAVHGTLHVLGHDHPEGPERERSPMFELQERLVREVLTEAEAP